MYEKVCAAHHPENGTIWAGYEYNQPPFPKKFDHGFFHASEVEIEGKVVRGRMNFPQPGVFEFQGTMNKLCKFLKAAGGASAVLRIEGFNWWMNS